jgi:predicted RNA-binding protein associated with RNAse of E/G family
VQKLHKLAMAEADQVLAALEAQEKMLRWTKRSKR